MMTTAGRSLYLDWTLVTDPHVDRALQALLTEDRMRDRWLNVTKEAKSVHRSIIEGFAARARAPTSDELSELGVSRNQIEKALQELDSRDLIVFRQGVIKSAYPFSATETPHTAEVAGVRNWTVCVVDALGTAAMLRKAATVHSSCPVCGENIEIGVNQNGLSENEVSPTGASVWSGVAETEGCAADTQCQSMLAFCSGDHLEDWKPENVIGFRLTPRQAIQVGAAIFKPFL